jgi:hypothetical protein
MYKLVDSFDFFIKKFNNIDDLNSFVKFIWQLQFLEQNINKKIPLEEMNFDDFKVYDLNNKFINELN